MQHDQTKDRPFPAEAPASAGRRLAPVLVLATGVCWGSIGLFVRPMEGALSSFEICFVRCTLTALMLVVLALARNRHALRIRLRDIWCFIGTGLLSVVFFSVCYYTTISLTSLSVAAVLLYTAPAFVLLMSRPLFGEAITPVKVLAVVLTIVGCVFTSGMVAGEAQLSPLGILIGIGSGFGYALYSIFSRFALQRGYEPLTISAWTFIFAAFGSSFLCNPVQTASVVLADSALWWPAIGIALVNAVIPYALYTTGLKYMENGRASVIVSVEPVVATLLGTFVFGEDFAWFNAVGIALILCAVVLLARPSVAKQAVRQG